MINFTVGPVQSSDAVRAIGAEQVPYFRTAEFSAVMLENEKLMLQFAKAPAGSRAVFMTGSGTLSMEATVANVLTPKDNVLVINGGSFGHRFVELCQIHGIPHTEVIPPPGDTVTEEQLEDEIIGVENRCTKEVSNSFVPNSAVPLFSTPIFSSSPYTALLVNVHETSTGVRYDIEAISRFCKRYNLLLIVDAISSFLADPFDMAALGADVMITGSQKALACPPGVSIIVLGPRAINRVEANDPHCLYLDLKSALKDQERGQTPFTCAVGTLLQVHARLKEIEANGGVESEMRKIAALAADFRDKIKGLPFEIVSKRMSNAVTPLTPTWMKEPCRSVEVEKLTANEIFLRLKDEYGIWVCPNGGDLKDKVFRVGHIGALTTAENDALIAALHDLQRRELI